MRRRHVGGSLPGILLAWVQGSCAGTPAPAPVPPPPSRLTEEAVTRGIRFLLAHQAEDGGFHSERYGYLRPGWSLTACILHGLALLPEHLRQPHRAAIARAFAFLAAGTDQDGAIGLGGLVLDYPSYSAAFTLLALAALDPPGATARVALHARHLSALQLDEGEGWRPEDLEYGGFALGGRPMPRPLGADNLGLSITTFVLEAVRAARTPAGDPLSQKASQFVTRCQCGPERGSGDAGGFFFTTAPPEYRSKAGDRPSPRPYGTATCDGITALLHCGVPADDPRIQTALRWLAGTFTLHTAPGFHAGQEPPMADSLRFYWYASLARCMTALGAETLPAASGPVAWRPLLLQHLLQEQQPDGSWHGHGDAMKEDDPLVATALALLALARCVAPPAAPGQR